MRAAAKKAILSIWRFAESGISTAGSFGVKCPLFDFRLATAFLVKTITSVYPKDIDKQRAANL